jgi:hypothetical protein
MPDIEKIINYIQVVLKLIFGDHVPPWVFPIIGYICLAAFILWVFRELLVFLATVKKLWVEELVPTLYNAEEKRRAQQRQRFADHVESERRYWAFIHANYLALFPKLIDRSQFNRRARSLRYLLNELCQDWAAELGVQFERHFLLDTTPVIAVGYRRDKSRSDFLGSAEYGYCSARRLKYFGYKLVMLTTLKVHPPVLNWYRPTQMSGMRPTRFWTPCHPAVRSGRTKASSARTGKPGGTSWRFGFGRPNARTSTTRIPPSLTAC